MKQPLILLFFLIIIISSCEKTITIDIEDKGRKIVVNSIFEADSILKVFVTESKYILDKKPEYIPITDASIILYENENEIETTNTNEYGIGIFNNIPNEGSQYRIVVSNSKYGMNSAKSGIPLIADITDIECKKSSLGEFGSEANDGLSFKLSFNDRENELNYYLVRAYTISSYEFYNGETGEFETGIDFYYLDLIPYEPSVISTSDNIRGLLFNDDLFDGNNYTLKFACEYPFFSTPDTETNKFKYYVVLYSLSEELYKYYLSYTIYDETVGNPFAEPVKVYNNIENGFGIFGGCSKNTNSVEIDNELFVR